MKKNWTVKTSDAKAEQRLASKLGVSAVLAKTLAARGYKTPEEAESFIKPAEKERNDPFLMLDMDKAVARIRLAIKNRETIGIMGDYDVDGITATAVLYKYFTRLGINMLYHIPSRTGEGYGISAETIKNMKNDGCSLLISVDCGITAVKEAEFCKEIGIDMIITDHHEVGSVIPDAVAVINPKREGDSYPNPKLSGVGVAYKLLCALGITDHNEEYTAFTAMGTLADMMPVTGENRSIITDGMKYIKSGVNTGLSQLMKNAGITPEHFNSFSVSFVLAPRMNAAGRMENAETALKLLLEDDPYAAELIAERLHVLNRERQETEGEIFSQAVEKIENDKSYDDDKVLILYDESWHQGVIGIVAAKLTEKYEKPAILFTRVNGSGKGSGRSVAGFSIHKAVSKCAELLTKFGGHEYAVGLSIDVEKIPAFRKKINEITSRIEMKEKTFDIDAEVYPDEISVDSAKSLGMLEPYGEGNPQPVYLLRDMKLSYMKLVGEKHVRIYIRDRECGFDAICYNTTPNDLRVKTGEFVDIVFTLGINEYNGQESPQIVVKDISSAGDLEGDFEEYEAIKNGAALKNKDDLPEFSDFERVYLSIAHCDEISVRPDLFAAELSEKSYNNISTVKLLIILSIFSELSLVNVQRNGFTVTASVVRGAKKTDLDSSTLFRRLKNND